MSEQGKSASLDEAQVVDYLRHNPDFFIHHDALLDQLRLPHPNSDGTVSLLERQLSRLREQQTALEQHSKRLTRTAQTNEQLLQRMQRFVRGLIGCRQANETLEMIDRLLRSDFHADAVAIHIFSGLSPDDHELPLFSQAEHGTPYTGPLSEPQLSLLFGEQGTDIASVVTIPLIRSSDEKIGLLAIGSIDPHRFEPAMGTEFVALLGGFIGELLGQQLHHAGE